MRVALVRTAFNASIVDGLANGAREALAEAGADADGVPVFEAPGAFELPLLVKAVAQTGRFDAIVALGAVIRGETDHYEHIATQASAGLAAVTRETGIPVGFGVLTVHAEEQALSRSRPGTNNKGAEAARAALQMAHLLRQLRARPRKPRPGRPRRRSLRR